MSHHGECVMGIPESKALIIGGCHFPDTSELRDDMSVTRVEGGEEPSAPPQRARSVSVSI